MPYHGPLQPLVGRHCSANEIDEQIRVRTHKLNENSDDDFEARTELNQPAGGLPVLIAN